MDNNCQQPTCEDCRHHDPNFIVTDNSGRKCAAVYYELGGMTLEEIAQLHGLTRERIRQIEYRAIKKLRHQSRSEILADYVDDWRVKLLKYIMKNDHRMFERLAGIKRRKNPKDSKA